MNLLLSILPGILIIIYIYKRDKYDKEPKKAVLLCVFLGALSCFPAALSTLGIQSLIGVNPVIEEESSIIKLFLFSVMGVGLFEEFSKYIFVIVYPYKKGFFNEPMDGIVYAVAVSMGFAILENILYVLDGGLSVALVRAFTAVPAHATFAVIMGYYVGLAKLNKDSKLLFLGLFYAAFAHGMYDFFLFSNNLLGLAIFAMIVLIYCVRLSKKMIEIHVSQSPFK